MVGILVDDFEKDPEREGRKGTVLSKMVSFNEKEGEEGGRVERKVRFSFFLNASLKGIIFLPYSPEFNFSSPLPSSFFFPSFFFSIY